MAVAFDASERLPFSHDRLSGAVRTHAIDRWIYVVTVAFYIAIVLTGFVPDSFDKVAAIRAGTRPPFPLILHVHAVLMGSFLLLLLAQTTLMATGNRNLHMQLGIAGMILAPVIIITGIVLVPTIYHSIWNAAQSAPEPARQQLLGVSSTLENILLAQLRVAIVFSILMWMGLRARIRSPGLHKRLIILAVAAPLPAAIDRIVWLPTTFPHSFLTTDIYTVLAFSPMLVWDVIRNREIHKAYWIWAAVFLPVSVALYTLWDTPWWHATARQIMGV